MACAAHPVIAIAWIDPVEAMMISMVFQLLSMIMSPCPKGIIVQSASVISRSQIGAAIKMILYPLCGIWTSLLSSFNPSAMG